MGKTWNSVHAGVDEPDNNLLKFIPWSSPSTAPRNVFRVYVSGNVVYALVGNAGC